MIPDISIIITNYNYSKYLDRCIRSCLNQQLVSHEVIVIDDNSSDNVDDVVKPYLNEIVYIKNENNLGVSESSNIGINVSKGRFFIRVDADDYINDMTCFFLKKMITENKDALGVACDYWYVDKHENKIERVYAEEKPISCGVLYRKELFQQIGGYNSEYRYKEHEEFLKRLDDYYKIYYLQIPFYRYRRHGENKTLSNEYKKVVI